MWLLPWWLYTVINQPNQVSECVFCVIRRRSGLILSPYIPLECKVCSVTSKDDLNVTELTVETWVSSVSVLRADETLPYIHQCAYQALQKNPPTKDLFPLPFSFPSFLWKSLCPFLFLLYWWPTGTMVKLSAKPHQVFSPAVLSTFKEGPRLRVDAHLVILSMMCFKKWINLHNLKKGCYLRLNSVLCWPNSA